MTYELGNRVIVKALRQRGKIASVSETPSGKLLLGIILQDEEKALRRKKGAVDVYVNEDQVDSFDSIVSEGDEEDEQMEDLITGYQPMDETEQDSIIEEG